MVHIGSSTQESRADCCNFLDRKTFFRLQNCKYPPTNSIQWHHFDERVQTFRFTIFSFDYTIFRPQLRTHVKSSALENECDQIEEPHFFMGPKQRMIYKQIIVLYARMWQTICELILNAVRFDGVKPLDLTLWTYEFSYVLYFATALSMYLQYSIAFENKQVKFYTITAPVAKSFVQMIMREGFPLRDRINFKIRFAPEMIYQMVHLGSLHTRRFKLRACSLLLAHRQTCCRCVFSSHRGHSTRWENVKRVQHPNARTHLPTDALN